MIENRGRPAIGGRQSTSVRVPNELAGVVKALCDAWKEESKLLKNELKQARASSQQQRHDCDKDGCDYREKFFQIARELSDTQVKMKALEGEIARLRTPPPSNSNDDDCPF